MLYPNTGSTECIVPKDITLILGGPRGILINTIVLILPQASYII